MRQRIYAPGSIHATGFGLTPGITNHPARRICAKICDLVESGRPVDLRDVFGNTKSQPLGSHTGQIHWQSRALLQTDHVRHKFGIPGSRYKCAGNARYM